MHIPRRAACFACASPARLRVWASGDLVLIRCETCHAEWVEGDTPVEQAYRYSHYDDDPLAQRYIPGRAARFAAYLRQFPMPPNGALLDVGCGNGAFLIEAKAAGWWPTGVELTEDAISMARALTSLPLFTGDLADENLFPPDAFDVVTLWGVLEHVPQPDALLKACLRVLRPGGLILLESPNAEAMFRLLAQTIMRASGGVLERPFRETLGAGHVCWYAPRSIRAQARSLGLQIRDLRGSRNSTAVLLDRFNHLPAAPRLAFKAGTAAVNYAALPLGRPNQLLAALARP